MERIARLSARWIGYAVILTMLVLLAAAVMARREPGSLDDLDAISIRKAVGE